MFFFNLGLFEFLALSGAVSGVVVALYLLNRARRKQPVATLRFWRNAGKPVAITRRRRIHQPVSLLLQLLGLLLLLLAIAQLRLGSPEETSRDHVLLLDTSSWMGARIDGTLLMDEAKARARAYIRALPATDRAMLLRADAVAMPATGFESDRGKLEAAINASRPSATALNLRQALSYATGISRLHTGRAGEVVYIGAGQVASDEALPQDVSASSLRVIRVGKPAENIGLTKIGLRRSGADPEKWQFFAAAHNYGTVARRVPLAVQFGGAPVGTRLVELAPGGTEETSFDFVTKSAGWLDARLLARDALADDNRAILELPALKPLKLLVYSNAPELLRPMLSANPYVEPAYRSQAQYDPAAAAQVVLLDGFAPETLPANAGVILVDPPASTRLVKRRNVVSGKPITKWRRDSEIASGLRSKRFELSRATVFEPGPEDVSIAEVDEGPVLLARPKMRMVALGFHPAADEMRFDLMAPLLIVNILRWLEPQVFRSWEMYGSSVGAVTVPFESELDAKNVRVLAEGRTLPFTIQNQTLRFYSGSPGVVRVITGDREQVYSLALPEVGSTIWQTPSAARTGLPGRAQRILARDIWQILALLGVTCLIAEWLLFGRKRGFAAREPIAAQPAVTGMGKTAA